MKRLAKGLLTLAVCSLLILSLFSCEAVMGLLGSGEITLDSLNGKKPGELYEDAVTEYNDSRKNHTPYALNIVVTNEGRQEETVNIDLIYDTNSFSCIFDRRNGDIREREELIYCADRLYYSDAKGGKYSYDSSREYTVAYVEESTFVKDIIPALPHELPDEWFEGLEITQGDDGEYLIVIDVDESKSAKHPDHKEFYRSGAKVKLIFSENGILDRIELSGVCINGESCNIEVTISWQPEGGVSEPTDKNEYPDRGEFDPNKGHKPGGDYRDENNGGNETAIPEASKGLEFALSNDGDYYIVTGIGSCTDTDVIIPSEYNGKPIKEIGDGAFFGLDELAADVESIVIPDSVTKIGSEAFVFADLSRITIPNSITSIGMDAFGECWPDVYISDISDWCNIYFEEGGENSSHPMHHLLYAGDLYLNNELVTDLVIPEGVTSISDMAFYNCNSIKSVVIPKSVASIGKDAFGDCDSLSNVYYTGTMEEWTKISVRPLNSYLTNAKRYYYSEEQPTTYGSFWHYVNGVPTPWEDFVTPTIYSEGLEFTSNGDGTCYVSGIGTCTDNDIVIPPVSPDGDRVTGIGESAFFNCDSLTSVVISDSVTRIGNSAFSNCDSLTSIVIPDSVMSIGDCSRDECSFCDCNSLTSLASIAYIFYTGNNEEWGALFGGMVNSCFADATCYFYSDTIPIYKGDFWHYVDGVPTPWEEKGIYSYGLEYTPSNDGDYYVVTGIGECTDYDIIILPEYEGKPVKEIGAFAFNNCRSITSIVIPDSVISIGSQAFSCCEYLVTVTIGRNVTELSPYSFEYCYRLIEIINNSSLDFSYCYDNFEYVHKGESRVTAEGEYLFYTYEGNNYLLCYLGESKDIVLPEKFRGEKYEINDYAFWDCDSLTSVVIGDSVTSIGDGAFEHCASLTSITVDESNTEYKSIDGNLYSKDGKTLIQYAIGKEDTEFVIPDGVTSIGDSAFWHCDSLTSVVIGDSVTSIGDYSFWNCDSLTSVVIGDSVTSIGDYSFWNCDSLTSVVIGDSVTSIGVCAFFACDSLTSIVIGDSITSIADDAFLNCDSLTDIYYTGTEEEWAEVSIGSGNEDLLNATIHYNYVPES